MYLPYFVKPLITSLGSSPLRADLNKKDPRLFFGFPRPPWCHLREAMRTKQGLRSPSVSVLRALVACAATAWECVIGIMSDEKPGMQIL